MSEIYDKTNIFKAYYGQVSEDARLAGVTDEVTLPNFENVSETLNLAGTVGEIDSPSAGQYKSATIDIPFTQVSKEAFGIMCDDPDLNHIDPVAYCPDTWSHPFLHHYKIVNIH